MKSFEQYLSETRTFTKQQAEEIGASLGINFNVIDLEQFRMGLGVESEHDMEDETDTVDNDSDIGKIAWTHLKELPDYYTRLEKMESEDLSEALIMYNQGKRYGQCVFVVGGTASGKSFALKNFIDTTNFKVLDVDALKTMFIKWNELKRQYPEFLGIDLTSPENVSKLHQFISDKKWGSSKAIFANIQKTGTSETLPNLNLMFDITLKDTDKLQNLVNMARSVGYDSKNIHITWVLTNYQIAIRNNVNSDRGRVVPEDILLDSHIGTATTMWKIITTKSLSGFDGSITVILNNPEETQSLKYQKKTVSGELMFDKTTDKPIYNILITGFTYLTVKKAGQAIVSTKEIKTKLYNWIVTNVPEKAKQFITK